MRRSARLCGLLSIAGTPGEVREQFNRLASNGVQRVFCVTLGDEAGHVHTMEPLAEHAIPGTKYATTAVGVGCAGPSR